MESEFVMTGHLRIIRLFAGKEAMPRSVFFAYPEPAYGADYRRIFGDVVHFGYAFTGMMFESAWLDREQLHNNPELFSVLQTQADRDLGRVMRSVSLTQRVLEHLNACNPGQMPSMEATASHLGMSERSLRQKLKLEGTWYRDLVIQTRSNMAKRMLENSQMSIQETGFAMGFATPSAFHHAFKQWTGMTPKEYRSSY
jgi:AraC-like DNA-binding protein